MIQTLFIRGIVPSLNSFSGGSAATVNRHKATQYGRTKQTWTKRVCDKARLTMRPIAGGAYFTFLHTRADKRMDPDNFCSVTQKVALDGLKKAGIIPNDGWADVLGLAHDWIVSKEKSEHGFWIVASDVQLHPLEAWGKLTARLNSKEARA